MTKFGTLLKVNLRQQFRARKNTSKKTMPVWGIYIVLGVGECVYTFRSGRCTARIETARKACKFAIFKGCQFLKLYYLCREKVENIMVFQI